MGIVQDGATRFNIDKEKYETVNIVKSDVSEFHGRKLKDFSEYYYMEEGLDENGSRIYWFSMVPLIYLYRKYVPALTC